MINPMKSIIRITLLSLVLIGCKEESTLTNTQIQGNGELIHLNTAGPINPKTKYVTYYEEHQKAWLFYGNEDKNELIIYELPSGRIEKRIKFEHRGPNGIGRYKGAMVQNFDSLFVISGTHYQDFFLIDTTGTVKRKYSIRPNESEDFFPALLPVYSHISQENVLRNGLINLSTYMMKIIANPDLHSKDICITYDIAQGKLVSINKYPKFDDTYKSFIGSYSRTNNGKEFIYSFPRLNEIYIQKEDGTYLKHHCPSKFQKGNLDWIANRSDPVAIQKENRIQNPKYGSIIFDKYRKLIYRIYIPGYNLEQGDSVDKYAEFPAVFSIIILDENLNMIGETLMPNKTYDPNMTFVAKEGIFVALHPDNPQYNPDSLAFEKMIIVEN